MMDGTIQKKPALYLAEFKTPDEILHAAEQARNAGYTQFDVHTPYPIHGMDEAMGLPDSRLGWIVFIAGLMGASGAALMIWWMNGVDYPLIIGGKPPFSIPSMVPVTFELTILFSALGAFFGMFHLNRLPRHHHPLFESERFSRFSDDAFFLSIEATDRKFDAEKTHQFLSSLHPSHLELVEETP